MNTVYCPTISLSYCLTVTLSHCLFNTVPSLYSIYHSLHTSRVLLYIHTYIDYICMITSYFGSCTMHTTSLPLAFSLLLLRDGSSVGIAASSAEEQVATAHERSDKQEPHKQNLKQLPHIIAVHYQRRHNYRYRAGERVQQP